MTHVDAVAPPPQHRTPSAKRFKLKACTANVLTLNGGLTKSQRRKCPAGRTGHLMRAFHEQGCHLVGLQETRQKEQGSFESAYYLAINSGAQADGNYGTGLWISTVLPLGEGKG